MQTFIPPTYTMDLAELQKIDLELAKAFNHLVTTLGPGRVCKLAELLEMVIKQTGYGSITLVVSDHRIQTVKQEISHSFKRPDGMT